MKWQDNAGFSLIELLAVVGIFMLLATISVIAWGSFGPTMALNGAAEGLGDSLELCMHKAATQKNEYFVLLNYRKTPYRTQDRMTLQFPANSYILADDDGWDPPVCGSGTGSGTRQYNLHTMYNGDAPEFRADWIPDDPNHSVNWRNNNLIESREVFRGPIRLGKGVFFQTIESITNTPARIVFSYRQPSMYWHGQNIPTNRPIASSERREEPVKIYLSDIRYKPGVTSKDNKAHLRVVRVTAQKVEVYRPA
ncbi:type II secretion system protein [bacterium]|nr:type II secretion system protein [candidate division CSSED10-310 bacterium]